MIKMAGKYRNIRCTEAHWMAVVVHPLLRVVRRLVRYEKDGLEKLEVADMWVPIILDLPKFRPMSTMLIPL